MNPIELKPTGLYPENAGHFSIKTGDIEHHTAYLVLGRIGDQALVIEGEGVEKAAAVEHMVRKVKLLRDGIDIALHGAFWRFHEEEQSRKQEAMREMLKGLMDGGRPMMELPTAKKDDDGGGLS